mmetsp:Transcript_19839/g.22076  ORF Transcript_19839/g.22076 Transcript_19839/m.22076 type:complete len:535 (-) Transcript_19839:10-1614(-)
MLRVARTFTSLYASRPTNYRQSRLKYAMAAKSQAEEVDKANLTEIEEGQAKIWMDSAKVFYNPVQEFNRDISILTAITYSQQEKKRLALKNKEFGGLDIFEALSATGLRSIRYFNEIPDVNEITVNDLDERAVETIRRNIEGNGIDTEKCRPNHRDARLAMYENMGKWNVIDLDPYGAPSIFVDAAVQSVRNGGLIMATATDLPVLCGNFPGTCYGKYTGSSMKSRYCHEQAVRLLLGLLATSAAKYQRTIEPLYSLYIDFYVRVFVRCRDSKLGAKLTPTKMGLAYQCPITDEFYIQPLATAIMKSKSDAKIQNAKTVAPATSVVGSKFKIAGPFWIGKLHDNDFTKAAIANLESPEYKDKFKTHKRMVGLLTVASHELENSPFFYSIPSICNTLRLQIPKQILFRSALVAKGYKVSISHVLPDCVKTDAPASVIWDMFRSYVAQNPGIRPLDKLSKNSPAYKILSVPPTDTFDFTPREDAEVLSKDIPRFIPNPPNWGPGTRPKAPKRKTPDDKTQNDAEDTQPAKKLKTKE